jgi:hypothetical protein
LIVRQGAKLRGLFAAKMSTLLAIVAGCAAISIVCASAGLAADRGGEAAAANSAKFTDPSGDSGSAPDVTTVAVANDNAGVLSLTVSVPNRASLSDVDGIRLLVDVDSNSGTGAPGGWEYEFGWIQGAAVLSRWDGSQFATVTPASFKGSYADAQAKASVNLSDIGGPTAFSLIVTTTGDGGDSFPELAPDSSSWAYSTVAATPPPPPPPPTGPPPPPLRQRLTAGKLQTSRAQAGKAFAVSMRVKDPVTGKGVKGTVTCAAKLAGKTLRASRKSSSTTGRAGCMWQLPRTARDKLLKGSITERYKGAKVSRSFSKRVA